MSDEMDKARSMLIDQIDKLNIDDSQKSELKKKISGSSDDELRMMVSQSQGSSSSDENGSDSSNCIFCSIVSSAVPSYKIKDNDHALAVLEINPASKGHVIIIPKKHGKLSSMPDNTKSLSKDVSDKIQSSLSPQKFEFSKSDLMGHTTFNIIPIYSDTPLEKKSASPEELEELQNVLTNEPIKIDSKKEVIVINDKPKKVSKKDSKAVVESKVEVKTDDSKKEKIGEVSKKSDKAKQFRDKAPSRIP